MSETTTRNRAPDAVRVAEQGFHRFHEEMARQLGPGPVILPIRILSRELRAAARRCNAPLGCGSRVEEDPPFGLPRDREE